MTLVETVAAAALLLVALGMVTKVITASSQAEQAAQRKAMAIEILSNLLEEKMALPEEITPENAATWQLPAEASASLPKLKLETAITPINGPPAGNRITLTLSWQDAFAEQTAPLTLTAFVFPREPEEMIP